MVEQVIDAVRLANVILEVVGAPFGTKGIISNAAIVDTVGNCDIFKSAIEIP